MNYVHTFKPEAHQLKFKNIYCNSFLLLHIAQFAITNGPTDTTVCDGNTVNISCGFINDPFRMIPNWRIIKKDSNSSIISIMKIIPPYDDGMDI